MALLRYRGAYGTVVGVFLLGGVDLVDERGKRLQIFIVLKFLQA